MIVNNVMTIMTKTAIPTVSNSVFAPHLIKNKIAQINILRDFNCGV